MGISGSRGKKVTPVSVTEGDPSVQTLKCQTSGISISRKNNQRVKQVAHFSTDDRKLAEDVDRILEVCENTENTKKKGVQKSPLYLCEKYTFCYNQSDQHDTESTHTADNIVPTDLLKTGRFEDKTDTCAFSKLSKPKKQTAVTTQQGDPDTLCTRAPHVPGICDDILLALPVAYDASEEDLMSAIEREFG